MFTRNVLLFLRLRVKVQVLAMLAVLAGLSLSASPPQQKRIIPEAEDRRLREEDKRLRAARPDSADWSGTSADVVG